LADVLPNVIRRYSRLQICATQLALNAYLLVAALCLLSSPARAATNDLTTALQRGLFEEEANQNLGAAIQAYQTVASQFDKDRKLAATAIFRLGECYRKQGNTNEAATQYDRILRQFSDQPTLVTLSRQNLAALGSAPPATATPVISDAARQEQKRLLEEEIKLVQKQLDAQQQQVQVAALPQSALWPTEREILKLKRQVAALDAGLPVSITATEPAASASSSEAEEVQRIQALIKDSPDLINAPDQKGETLLQSAAAKGKLAVVKVLLENGAAVDGLQQPGLTPLHYAAANGHKAVVDLLLSKGAKSDAQTEHGVTPLHLAARKGYETVAKALLAAGAPVNSATRSSFSFEGQDLQYAVGSGQTPLHLAANAGYSGMVELLLAKGAETNAEDGDGRTPLSYAVQKHYDAVARVLLAAHANPNAGRLDLPLATAAFQGNIPALKLLLANGADPNTNSTINWNVGTPGGQFYQGGKFTPLFLAVSQRKADAAKELLRCKADPNLPGPRGNPLLYDALSDAPTLKVLLDGGADPNARTLEGTPMLLQAVYDKNQPAVELLLAHRAEVNCTEAGRTPLLVAAANGLKPIAELLLKAGATVNTKDENGETPLHAAVGSAQPELAELLLANKADPNAKNKNGWTPLHMAVRDNRPEIVKLLLANKADPNERNNSGQTPLDLTKSQGPSAPGRPPGGVPGYPVPAGIPGPIPLNPAPPLAYQWQAPGTPAATPGQESKPETMAELLRRHGAADDLPRLDRIEGRRPSINYSFTVFAKGTNDWNQFSLFELIAVHYGFLAAWATGESRQGIDINVQRGLPFPDFARLRIRRPGADLKSWEEKTIDLTTAFKSTNCSADVPLAWGDVIEIPESDHPLDKSWPGFSMPDFATLEKCLTRQVEIVIKGQSTNITLFPDARYVKPVRTSVETVKKASFWIKPVLRDSGLLLASSDLSRVKVTRRDPATGQTREWVVDCSETKPAPDLWLRDGDKIEVPEKTDSASGN
jgi:ankyrin repeat protein